MANFLVVLLQNQLDRRDYRVHTHTARSCLGCRTFIPDVVIPAAHLVPFAGDPRSRNVYAQPLPLVVEVWSPSTGGYDVATKLPGYQARGGLEIWRIHPFERTLAAWRPRPDGS